MPLLVDDAPQSTTNSVPVGTRKTRALPLVVLIASLVLLVGPSTASSSASHPVVALNSLEVGVLAQLNEIRAQHHLVPLTLSAPLTVASRQHSAEMAADGYFDHTSHDGTAFWKRIGRWYPQSAFHHWSVGENLLWSSPDIDPARALDMWMVSPEHRANILASRWREVGVAAVHVAGAPGAYDGRTVTIITTDFGARH